MGDYPWRVQLLYATLLCLALLLFFLPLPTGWVVIGCVLTLLVSGYKGWRVWRYSKKVKSVSPYLDALDQELEALPERLRRRLPVMLVTGDVAMHHFSELLNTNVTVTGQGIWVTVPDMAELSLTADALIGRWPEMTGRIGVLFSLIPERYETQQGLVGYLQAFRQSWADASRTTGYKLPIYLVVSTGLVQSTPHWFWWTKQSSEIRLLDECQTPLSHWCNEINSEASERQYLAILLKTLQQWLDIHVMQVLSDKLQPVPLCIPGAVACLTVNNQQVNDNVWQHYLREITTLSLPASAMEKHLIALPERLIQDMPVYCPMSGKKRAVCHGLIFTALFGALALCSSAYNNLKLLDHIASDLKVYNSIAMDSYDQKLRSLQVLKSDRQQLDKYYRESEPAHLGLGLYTGWRLITPLDRAINGYQPPPPPPIIDVPKLVRLDSMSLFDTGKSALKPDSTKILVEALINIKAKPGWLILIAGHTDNTGDPQRNQLLSLARAESVRDWIIQTSDLSTTCFAIQGYGATQPIASNNLADGRAANRRVEISLVPEASACQPGSEHQTPQ